MTDYDKLIDEIDDFLKYEKDRCLEKIMDAFMELSIIVEREPDTRWISVHKALPKDEVDVLVCSDTGNIEVSCGSRSTEIEDEFIWYTSGWIFGKVIAWMPLPEPYKEEANG